MAKRKGDRANKHRLADMAMLPAEAARFVPHRPPDAEIEYQFTPAEGWVVHYRLWVERGATTDFLIRLIRLADGKETDVLRFDCCHGEVHVHRRYRNASETRKVILAIETQEHVEAGLQLAEDMLGKESELIRMGWDS